MRRLAVLVAVAAAVLVGCVTSKVHKLPAYDAAMALPGSECPKLFFAEAIDRESLPVLVPYAQVIAQSGSNISREARARDIWIHAKRLKADVVVIEEAGQVYTGSTSAYLGFGISQSAANYASGSRGNCYRLATAKLGTRKDENGMITFLTPELRACGLLEGDHILSINGMEFDKDAHLKFMLASKPGDVVALVWVRPGAGRMEGKVALLPNPPTHLALADSMDLPAPKSKRQPGPRAE